MPIKEIKRLRTSAKLKERVSVLMAMNCAPILKGSKAANIMTVTRREAYEIGSLLQGTDISWRVLDMKAEKVILYLYREKKLREYLQKEDISLFLAGCGYDGGDVRKMLQKLTLRLRQYDSGLREYPHEMGIFLGYPLKDVTGFMENGGENYAYLGYWKVYHDVSGAIRLFHCFDQDREQAVSELVMGKTIREIAVS